MAILNAVIPPITVPVLDGAGKMNTAWYLFLLNVSQTVSGGKSGTPVTTIVYTTLDTDSDADTADFADYPANTMAVQQQIVDEPIPWIPPPLVAEEYTPYVARAQPVTVLTPSASPWLYPAPFDGTLLLAGGSVSVTLSRDGTNYYAVPEGVTPMSRLDIAKITYTSVPTTAIFFPR